ncbi:hypothetical protein ACVWZ8_001328 [Arthrobacter sp. UYCu723]
MSCPMPGTAPPGCMTYMVGTKAQAASLWTPNKILASTGN